MLCNFEATLCPHNLRERTTSVFFQELTRGICNFCKKNHLDFVSTEHFVSEGWETANGGGGGAKRIMWLWGGKTYCRVPLPKPLLKAWESGIGLVGAPFLWGKWQCVDNRGGGTYHKWGCAQPFFLGRVLMLCFPSPEFPPLCLSWRRTNVQRLTCKMVWSFPFILFKKALILRKVVGGKLWKSVKKVWKSAKEWEKSAEMILPFSCCPLVFLWLSLSERGISVALVSFRLSVLSWTWAGASPPLVMLNSQDSSLSSPRQAKDWTGVVRDWHMLSGYGTAKRPSSDTFHIEGYL